MQEEFENKLTISIHSLRVEGDIGLPSVQCVPAAFQSTPSVWRETVVLPKGSAKLLFQSTPSVWRETFPAVRHTVPREQFQSTPSVWRETVILQSGRVAIQFQSTPSVWRETLVPGHTTYTRMISIHSLRVEGDKYRLTVSGGGKISIHSLRVEGDTDDALVAKEQIISIHSLRVEGDIVQNPNILARC